MSAEEKLEELGLALPVAPKPVASYLPAVTSAGHVFVSGQLPMREGQLTATGSVPSAVTLEEAQQAARPGRRRRERPATERPRRNRIRV